MGLCPLHPFTPVSYTGICPLHVLRTPTYIGETVPSSGQANRAGGVGGGEGVQQVAAQPPGQGLRVRPAKEGPQGACSALP